MDSKWIQGRIEEYSFYRLAKQILPESEFPVLSYPFAKESLMSSKMESMREKMIPQFLYITKKEEQAIFDGTWNENTDYEHEIMKYGFYFVDVPLGNLDISFKSWFCDQIIDDMLKPYYSEDDGSICFSKRLLVKAVFCILHEYGHYVDYKKFNSKKELAMWIYKAKEPYRRIDTYVCKMNREGHLTEGLLKERRSVYRNWKDEDSADQYALNYLNEMIDKAIDSIWNEGDRINE